jgi:cytochrome c oxidase subunit 2
MQSALSPAGIQASRVLELWHITLTVCCVVFACVLLACMFALLRAPRGNQATPADMSKRERPERGIHRFVIVGTVLSALGLVSLLVADVVTDRALSRLPVDNALHVEMTGYQWWWQARYAPEGGADGFAVANELHVPVGRPVVVSLKAADVIHTFWVPNLHGKKDMIPGQDSTITFRADRAGTYRGQCAEFCGYEHAMMAFSVVADPPEQYAAWAAQQRQTASTSSDALAMHGRDVFLNGDCARCHTVRGTPANGSVGPDLTHLASRQTIAAGTFVNNAHNLAAWITNPPALKPGVMMPATQLAPGDLQALVVWLGTLK